MHEIHDHKTNAANEKMQIIALDDLGPGGANHAYQLDWGAGSLVVLFQKGPIAEVGANGVTNEALLALVIDRMRAFQMGDFACEENAEALHHLILAMGALRRRTAGRVARGVEGTNTP